MRTAACAKAAFSEAAIALISFADGMLCQKCFRQKGGITMLRLYSPKAAERIIRKYCAAIDDAAARFSLPAAFIKALLYTEIVRIDVMDPLADLVVRINLRAGTGLLRKRDSSTGYGQIFGFVAINAANFAAERGIASYASLGLPDRPLDPDAAEDLRLVWTRLNRDPAFNIALSALNLICAADEVFGRTDFTSFSPDEIRRIYTRYNGTSKQITPYGEEAYRHYLRYSAEG